MMKGKRNLWLIGLTSVIVLLVCISTSCISMAVGIANGQYKDFGVYDETVPVDQLCELRLTQIYIKSFNGNSVSWGRQANNFGYIKIPAGTNDFVFDYLEIHENLTDIRSNGDGTETWTFTTTANSMEDMSFTDVTMLPGHKYVLFGGMMNDEFIIFLRDVTNTPSRVWGDETVFNAPKVSKIPTELEGTWIASDGTTYTFAGNTFEMNYFAGHPLSQPGIPEKGIIMQGTFLINGNKITMYTTKQGRGGENSWLNVSALRQSFIHTYSFSEGNLILEIECLVSPMAYSRK